MAVQTTMTNKYTKASDAIKQSQNSKNSGAVGYTTRGTAIVNSNTELGQNAFLNILVAELSNMDPTQDQDSTAYVTQMAEFASIEQLNNLNTTMKSFAYQQMVGQAVILSEKDADGNSIYGVVTQIFKNGSSTMATIKNVATGEIKNYDVSKIIGTCDTGYNDSIYETALNSHYNSAIILAGMQADTIILDYTSTKVECMDKDGNTLIKTTTTNAPVRGKIVDTYLDKVNNKVMIRVQMQDADGRDILDESGEKTYKDYDYSMVAIAGAQEDETKKIYDKYKTAEPIITYTNKLTGAVVSNPILKTEQTESSSSGTSGSEAGSSSSETEGTSGSEAGSSSSETEGTSGSGAGSSSSGTEGTNSNVTNEGIRNVNNSYSNEEIYNAAIASENNILSRILES